MVKKKKNRNNIINISKLTDLSINQSHRTLKLKSRLS